MRDLDHDTIAAETVQRGFDSMASSSNRPARLSNPGTVYFPGRDGGPTSRHFPNRIPIVSFARRAALVAPGLTAVGTRATIPIPRGVRDRYGMLKPLKEARDLNGPDA